MKINGLEIGSQTYMSPKVLDSFLSDNPSNSLGKNTFSRAHNVKNSTKHSHFYGYALFMEK